MLHHNQYTRLDIWIFCMSEHLIEDSGFCGEPHPQSSTTPIIRVNGMERARWLVLILVIIGV